MQSHPPPQPLEPTIIAQAIFPTVVSKAQQSRVGKEVLSSLLDGTSNDVQYPVCQGVVENWDCFERILHYSFYNELRAAPEEHPVLLLTPLLDSGRNREKLTQIAFETFSVPAFYVTASTLATLYASGNTTGVVLDIGEGTTQCLPTYLGYPLTHAAARLDYGGRDITDHLIKLMKAKGHSFPKEKQRELAKQVKEKLCYVAENFDKETQKDPKSIEASHELNGQTISLDYERCIAPEAFFRPTELFGLPSTTPSLPQLIHQTTHNCDIDTRKDLLSTVILSGGSSLFEGLPTRLKAELSHLEVSKVGIVAPVDRLISSWVGGSIIASLSTFQSRWISKEMYDEKGPSVVHSSDAMSQ